MDVGQFVCIKPNKSRSDSNAEPFARSGHCCATDRINMFVFGGYHPEFVTTLTQPVYKEITLCNEVFREMLCFNLYTETWHEVRTFGEAPWEAASMSMLLHGQTLFMFGGTSYPWGETSNSDVIAFKLKDKTWSTLACKGQRPPGKYGQAMVLRHGCLYLYGGCRQISSDDYLFDSDVHCLDARSQTWSLLSDQTTQDDPEAPSRGMYRHGLAWHNNKLYVIGSSWTELHSLKYQDKIHVYSLETNLWSTEMTKPCLVDRFPLRRKYHSCVQWKNEVYICGGHNHRKVFGDVWKLELPSLQWSKIPALMPVPAYFHTAAITPSKCMYIFGGVTCLEDRNRTNGLYRIWLTIPPLLDMALRKVVSLLPNLNSENIAKLQDLGIPRSVLDRLKHIE
ncbi:kelch domain-containing protein 10-like [Asterias rubens]|uniref:kelch domain-containing protein 10-like n=1 Tax=Asterias rubens TaxID=7604 RepID=UPI001455B097|nr:kelch domain-containing protein 10-like [Asterias rubens]